MPLRTTWRRGDSRVSRRYWSRAVAAGVSLIAMLSGGTARAEGMDFALSHLRLPGGTDACAREVGAWCPDQALFERLVAEAAVAAADPVLQPASSMGVGGMQLSLSTTSTTVDSDASHWVRGSAGEGASADLANNSPSALLTFNRLHLRKGLPFGFEVGGSVGRGLQSSTWVFGAQLKLALLSGFRSGTLGALPDVALHGAVTWAQSRHAVSTLVGGLSLLLSKPLPLAPHWTVSPIGVLQLMHLQVSAGVVDLSPEDAEACEDCDVVVPTTNMVRFADVEQQRLRAQLGAEIRRGSVGASVGIARDLLVPDPQTVGGSLARHLSFTLAFGLRY